MSRISEDMIESEAREEPNTGRACRQQDFNYKSKL